MEDAKSSPSRAFSGSTVVPSSPANSLPRHVQVQFPMEDDHSSFGDDASRGTSSIGLGPPPILRRATMVPGKGPPIHVRRKEDIRRRVRSADISPVLDVPSFGLDGGDFGRYARRTPPTNRKSSRRDAALQGTMFSEGPSDLSQSSMFSDEYDLYPRIIEDVQRAIKLKARREARFKASRMSSPQGDPQSKADIVPRLAHSSPVKASIQIPTSIAARNESLSNDSEIDFSPSIGTMPRHPVPSSSNGGATLDWTGSASEDEKAEKKWPLHLPKRKHRSALPASRTIVEKQDSLYADKLARIRSKVNANTLRKAEITRDQLHRRYNMLLLHQSSVDLLKVAHWYDKQEPVVKTSLDKAEPLTWLKHLLDKNGRKSTRSPWFVTALTIEEYVKAHTNHQTMATIPEDNVPTSSPTIASVLDTMSPSSGSWSWNPSPQFLEPSLSRRRSSYDQQVSFEPHLESGRESVGGESRPSSEGHARSMRYSLPAGTESARSSIYSGKTNRDGGLSNKNGHHLRNLAKRLRRRPYESDEALTSAQNSLSEHEPNFTDEGNGRFSDSQLRSRPTSLRVLAPEGTKPNEEQPLSEVEKTSSQENLPTATAEAFHHEPTPEGTAKLDVVPDNGDVAEAPASRTIARRRARMSLPSSHHLSKPARRESQVDLEKERQEYERKAQMLDDVSTQNFRTRHLLQRVGASIREYDNFQSSLAAAVGTPYPKIPSEILEAFSHDPSAITGATRYSSGWVAVEDIYDRIQRQRRTLRTFAASLAPQAEMSDNIFIEPIGSLNESLADLERHHRRIEAQSETVAESLARVKETHSTVKKDYNDAMAHTSLIYPELSQIVALEESYRNHYQQLWDIGLDALTLLLDTVTPFWRNYGKVIGEDVQDFLIIPWYRNEFTGEAKRYPLEKFPRRSFRHCLGLICLSFCSVCVTVLQTRFAIELTLHWDLPWISHTGLWWLIFPVYSISLLIQWTAVLIELCILVAQGGVVIWWLGWAVHIFT